MLGIVVSERTVSRILRSVPRPPSQNWKTFLKNHGTEIMAIDFFTVPTFTFKVLFVFVVLAHRRREVLHFNVTEHPTAEWIAQQLVEAVADRDAPRYSSVIAIECTAGQSTRSWQVSTSSRS